VSQPRLDRDGFDAPVEIVAIATFMLIAWMLLPVFLNRVNVSASLLYVVAVMVPLIDALDLGARLTMMAHERSRRRSSAIPTSVAIDTSDFTPFQIELHLRPYAIVASVHNLGERLDDFLDDFELLHGRLFIVDDASTDDTWVRLQQSGIRCYRLTSNRKKPGAIKHLLDQLPPEIATVLVVDPDVRLFDASRPGVRELERIVFDFQQSGRAAATPRVTLRWDGILASLQNFEYSLSCALGRRSLADRCVTSGVALYRRDALATALAQHSLCVYAEDLRNALILLGQGETIYYDGRLVFETEGKRTWRTWFSQRTGWAYGFISVYLDRFKEVRRSAKGSVYFAYQFIVYMGVFSFPLQPFRVLSLVVLSGSLIQGVSGLIGIDWIPSAIAVPADFFVGAYVKYTLLCLAISPLIVGSGVRWWRLASVVPLYFFYALANVLPTAMGYLNWLTLRLVGARVYRDHYVDEASLRAQMRNGRRHA
jgi:cellulose synthase/poly-beta-1,6-N-acetylglucosamine synthase-like glycosyltransferase